MGFFSRAGDNAEITLVGNSTASIETLHRHECALCPRNDAKGLCHPKMPATGTKKPLIYVLGEAPGEDEDEEGVQFVGRSGNLLKRYLDYEDIQKGIRWNNVVRCLPPLITKKKKKKRRGQEEQQEQESRTPDEVMIECCRPSIERDIEATKPYAIFGFGNIALHWATKQTGITKWTGRRIPIQIGEHRCWFFPFMHPAFIARSRRFEPHREGQYGSDDEFTFALQVRRAVQEIVDGQLPEPIVHTPGWAQFGVDVVDGRGGDFDIDTIRENLARLENDKVIGFDYETKGFRPYNRGNKLLSVAFSGKGTTIAIALDHKQNGWRNGQRAKVQEMIEEFIYRKGKRLVSHHLQFELEWTAFYFGDECIWGVEWGDTESQAYILDERPYTFALNFICIQYFGLDLKAISNLDRDHLDDAYVGDVLTYNGLDARYHRLAYLAQAKRLKDEGLQEVYQHQLERTIATVPMAMNGVPIDQEMHKFLRGRYEKRLDKIEQEIAASKEALKYKRLFGKAYRPSAIEDAAAYMTDFLGMSGFKNVDDSTLAGIKDPLIEKTRAWRKTNKVLSTYVLSVAPDSKNTYDDGLLHPWVKTCDTRTWRTSSEEPNTQNWPKRSDIAKKARRQVYRENHVVAAFDFAGIQARNVAMESKDEKLVKLYWDKYDIHSDWVERILRHVPNWQGGYKHLKSDPAIWKKARDIAKNKLVFPTFFGAQPKSKAVGLEIPEHISEKLHEEFLAEYSGLAAWQEGLIELYKENGYVTGLSGFRRRAPIARNQIVNSPIQADESIIVCSAMVALSKRGFNPMMEVHDDLTFLWPKKKVDEYAEIVISEMLKIRFPWINVPLGVEFAAGEDWGSMQQVGEYESIGLTDEWRELKK